MCVDSCWLITKCVVPSRHGATVAFVGLEPGSVQQMARDHALHHMQHRRDQLGLCNQKQAQGYGQRQHPLPHRHVRNDVVDQVRRGLRLSTGAARRIEPGWISRV
jgi:hypothetical protein